MRILGVKMTRLTNSRGFVVEISAATVVVLGSRFSLPISTTHCLVGAVAGIGELLAWQGAGGSDRGLSSKGQGRAGWWLRAASAVMCTHKGRGEARSALFLGNCPSVLASLPQRPAGGRQGCSWVLSTSTLNRPSARLHDLILQACWRGGTASTGS